MSKLTSGEVTVQLDGQDVVLRPTLGAAIAISGAPGGFQAALGAAQRLDIAGIARVINLATGADEARAKAMPGLVYTAGVINLNGPVARYLTMLLYGGREPPDDEPKQAAPKGN